ncbi:sensor histidine kinase [Pedobacter sp. Du54]|uniref:sensor histidine kinase n=1 Tax=Pedobacter anseongensis TaxID=3133439 RepID=UPI0030A0EBB0
MGDNVYILIFYTVLAVFVLITFFLILYIKGQNIMWQQRRDFQESEILQQKQLLSAVIESQEIERKRIGEDLHDEIGGTLSAIKLMLNANKQSIEDQDTLLSARQLIDKMINDVRNIAHDLSPPGLTMFGLYHTLESFISLINKTGKIEVLIHHEPYVETRFLTEKIELALFRIITQLIANTLKHANASQINLIFKPNDKNLVIDYNDNGIGFDLSILTKHHGIGVQNIKSRLQMIDATYTLESSPDRGFKVNIVCPIEKQE